MNIIMLGAPGAGKGTQAEVLSEKYKLPIISTGNILKEAVREKTPLGIIAKEAMDSGALVPDDVVIGIVKERVAKEDCAAGFIMDGFPRTTKQAKALDEMGIEIDLALSIEVPDEKIVERMSGRRICSKCSASYHVVYKPSKKEGLCDLCGGELIIRSDDDPKIVASRLTVYHENTAPLKDYYDARGKLKVVIGQEKVEDTTALTLAAVQGMILG